MARGNRLFGRHDTANETDTGAALPAAPPTSHWSVAGVLRATREEAGLRLQDVATAIRVRGAQLRAIEEGRYHELPGTVYATGFVRAYADYLGLDVEAVTRRFKEEIAGLDQQTELVFPTPVPEGRVPGGAILMVALLLAGAAYAGWLYLESSNSRLTDLAPALPDRLAELLDTAGVGPERDAEVGAGADGAAVLEREPGERVEPPVVGQTGGSEPLTPIDPPVAPAEPAEFSPSMASAAEQPAAEEEAADRSPSAGLVAPEQDEVAPADAASVRPASDDPGRRDAAAALAQDPPADSTLSEPAGTVTESLPDSAAGPPPGALETPDHTAPPEVVVAETPSDVAAVPGFDEPPAPALPSGDSTIPDDPAAAPAPDGVAAGHASGAGTAEPAAPETERAAPEPDTGSAGDGGGPQVAAAPPPPPPPAASADSARTYGLVNGDSRILIRATQDSWVQVSDGDGGLIMTRVLRPGDTYQVPTEQGLELVTGNAGGLEILVDGDPTPSLGGTGVVVRDIQLDPDRLREGTAVPN
jgi:cytoskeletal protein RodZ